MEQKTRDTMRDLSEETLQEVTGGMDPQARIQAAQERIGAARADLLRANIINAGDNVPGAAEHFNAILNIVGAANNLGAGQAVGGAANAVKNAVKWVRPVLK